MPRSTIARRIFYLFCIFLVIYVLCFQWELLISLGLGEDNIKEFTFGLIPAVAAVTLALALYWENISIASVIPTAIIGISWIVTGPLLNFSTLVKSNTIYLNNIYAPYFTFDRNRCQ